jgi:hypothetical protein
MYSRQLANVDLAVRSRTGHTETIRTPLHQAVRYASRQTTADSVINSRGAARRHAWLTTFESLQRRPGVWVCGSSIFPKKPRTSRAGPRYLATHANGVSKRIRVNIVHLPE